MFFWNIISQAYSYYVMKGKSIVFFVSYVLER
jgi:hypothetical protein